MRIVSALAIAVVALFSAIALTVGPADAHISCSHHFGCVDGKYTRRPVAGSFCRSVIRKRPGYRTHFFCTVA